MTGVYVTLVDDNKYIAPAIVLAYSIQKTKSDNDLVVFITNKITNDGKHILSSFYNKVKLTDNYKNDLKKLDEYKKIILINPDTIIMNNSIITFNDKPYLLESEIDINKRIKNHKNMSWHKLYSEILSNNSDLKTNKLLSEVNELHNFFTQRIITQEKHMLNISRTDAVSANFDNKQLCFIPSDIQQMFENIKPYDYFAPIDYLAENFKSKYYSELLKKKINLPNISLDKIMLNTNIDAEDLDNIMLYYLKCRKNVRMIIFFNEHPERIEKLDKIDKELCQFGNIYYVKHILLTYHGIKNMMFWMYDDVSFTQRYTDIDNKIMTLNLKQQETNQITIVLFENIKTSQDYKTNITNIIRHNLIYITENFYQTIIMGELLLNKNSLSLLDNQDIIFKSIPHLKFQTFRKRLYTNLSPLEMAKIFVIGGSVFYAYGLRDLTDITSIMIDPNDPELEQLMFDMFTNKSSKLEFTNMSIEGKFWKDKWSKKNKKLTDFFDIESICDIATNPRFHFYYQGMKFYLIDHEIVRRLFRGKEQDYADILMIIFADKSLIKNYVVYDNSLTKFVPTSDIFKQIIIKRKKTIDYNLIISYMNKYNYSFNDNISIDEAFIKRIL